MTDELKVTDVKKVKRDSDEQAAYTAEMEPAGDSDDDEAGSNTEWAKIKTRGTKPLEKGDRVKLNVVESQSTMDDHTEEDEEEA